MVSNAVFWIAVILLIGNIVWQSGNLWEIFGLPRVQYKTMKALIDRGVIRRIRWTVGNIHRSFPDMLIVEGDGWRYEPFMPAPQGHHFGVTPREVIEVFARFGPSSDDALRVVYRLQKKDPGIKCGCIYYDEGMTTMMGIPAFWSDFVPTTDSQAKALDKLSLH